MIMGHHIHSVAMPLRGFPTKKRSIERQFMRKCLIFQELHSQPFPEEGQCFKSLLMQHALLNGGSILMSMKKEDIHGLEKLSAPHLNEYLDFTVIDRVKCLQPVKLIVLNSDQVASLQTPYKLVYTKRNSTHGKDLQSNHQGYQSVKRCLVQELLLGMEIL